MMNPLGDLLESVALLLTHTKEEGAEKAIPHMNLVLLRLQEVLYEKRIWFFKYSRTMSAISADLGIIPEKPISGPTQDTAPDQSGGGSKGGEKSSTQELDS